MKLERERRPVAHRPDDVDLRRERDAGRGTAPAVPGWSGSTTGRRRGRSPQQVVEARGAGGVAANRDTAALRAWADLLGAIARERRPVVLPLHPGTAGAIAAAGIALAPEVHVVGPVGYRTSLALQLHSAAVVTDSAASSGRRHGSACRA